ncbi:endosomal SPRY domain-containingprotein [Purpureocillium lavendulum]|uniref:Endosomal SPRY domain-containingprotein n=1 Tax=Purpureocillium lavendulum TaxID=1247861 RepID=A0AB34FRR1_9HYPO|nr:endosomal SPRY domain-containingprotein [Purpureocillium lavendulum]
MAPTLAHALRSIIPSKPTADETLGGDGGPLAEASRLLARSATQTNDPSRGVLDPHDISNVGFFVLFALIGLGFVITGIWFFFWAKNGGFHFKENDWDDYKSTVLRRKGPNGTLLSGATPSTNLGGGSVYKDVADDDGTTVVTETTYLSGITAGASDIAARKKREEKRKDKERRKQREAKDKKDKKNSSSNKNSSKRHVGDNGVTDEMAEKEARDHLRSYRHERPARVGGLNKESEGSTWDGSTNPTESTASTELLSNRQTTPTTTPTKPIRKVYSTADRNTAREAERIRSEARRLREESRSRTARRDFSYNNPESALSESLLEKGGGGQHSSTSGAGSSDLGTKSYHHPMPELRERDRERDRQREREERRARRGGYRRGRGDDADL